MYNIMYISLVFISCEKVVENLNKRKMITLLVIFDIVSVLALGWAIYINDYYKSKDVDSYISDTAKVSVVEIDEGLFFDGAGQDEALIFYPGAKVEYKAYAPLMNMLAQSGLDCFLIEMPGNMAFLGKNKANDIIEQYDYDAWYIGGHSLGGAMASVYCKNNSNKIKGLILLAAYSNKDISDSGVEVLSIYGDKDEVLNRKKYDKYTSNLPDDYTQLCIEGGNHSGFGDYGEQNGDGCADISKEEQWDYTCQAITAWMDTE